MTRRTRWILALVGLVAAGAAAALAWRQSARGLDVEIAVATDGPFEEQLVEDGRTRARWHEAVTAPVGGQWTPAGRKAGDSVAAGALLGTLGAVAQDPATTTQLRARLGAAEAARAAAAASLATATLQERDARRARERSERLSTSGGVSEEQLEIAQATHEGAQRALEAARARLAAAEFEAEAVRAFLPGGAARPVELRAPASGIVLRVDEEHARVVPAGTPLLEIGAVGTPEIVARVLSADAPRVRVGAPLYAIIGSDTLRGHVTRIEPSAITVRSALGVEEQRVPVIGDVHDARVSLGHDFQVDVRIVVRRLERAVRVPTGALMRDGAGWRVYTVGADDRVAYATVTVVARGAEVSAVEGIPAGTSVVVYPPEGLAAGVRVQ